MKTSIPVLFLFFSSLLTLAQDVELAVALEKISNKIRSTDNGERLKWMDSLAKLTKNRTDLGYDSIVRGTISYAKELDCLNIAAGRSADLIFYLSNRIGRPAEGLELFLETIRYEENLKNSFVLGQLYLNGADSYYYTGKTQKAIEAYEKAALYAERAEDSVTIGAAKEYKADAYAGLGLFSKATQSLNEAERIYAAIKDTTRQILTQNSRANLYSQNGFFKEAEEERREVIAKATHAKYYPALLSALYNSAIDNRKAENYLKRIDNLQKALTFTRASEFIDLYEPRILNSLLQAYSKVDSLKRAEEVFHEIMENPERNTKGVFEPLFNDAMGYYYFAMGDYQKALDVGKVYLQSQEVSRNIENLVSGNQFLSQVYEKLGDPVKAFEHYKTFNNLRDSINSVQKVNVLSYYQTLYETEKRDAKIEAQSSEIALLDTKNKVKNQWILFGGLGLLALFTISYLVRSRNFVQKKKHLLTEYSQNLIKGQEEERSRLARELHDSVGQKLMLLTKKTKSVKNQDMEWLATNTLEELRSISRGLQPVALEQLGTTAAIRALIDEIDANSDIFFTHEIDQIDSVLDEESSLHLYRIIQETLSNMIKHAEAKAASVEIDLDQNRIEVLIKDNGKGFNFEDMIKKGKSLGLRTLLERAKIMNSKLHVKSEHGNGTAISLIVPIHSPNATPLI